MYLEHTTKTIEYHVRRYEIILNMHLFSTLFIYVAFSLCILHLYSVQYVSMYVFIQNQ